MSPEVANKAMLSQYFASTAIAMANLFQSGQLAMLCRAKVDSFIGNTLN